MFEALFILTTVDTGTRVARFLLQELGSHVYKPPRRQRWMPGIIITSFLVVRAWAYLIHFGSIFTILPMYGVPNQLLSAIAFGVGKVRLDHLHPHDLHVLCPQSSQAHFIKHISS
jgi:carbon starvation protein